MHDAHVDMCEIGRGVAIRYTCGVYFFSFELASPAGRLSTALDHRPYATSSILPSSILLGGHLHSNVRDAASCAPHVLKRILERQEPGARLLGRVLPKPVLRPVLGLLGRRPLMLRRSLLDAGCAPHLLQRLGTTQSWARLLFWPPPKPELRRRVLGLLGRRPLMLRRSLLDASLSSARAHCSMPPDASGAGASAFRPMQHWLAYRHAWRLMPGPSPAFLAPTFLASGLRCRIPQRQRVRARCCLCRRHFILGSLSRWRLRWNAHCAVFLLSTTPPDASAGWPKTRPDQPARQIGVATLCGRRLMPRGTISPSPATGLWGLRCRNPHRHRVRARCCLCRLHH